MRRAGAALALAWVLASCGGDEAAPAPEPGPLDVVVKTYCDCMFLACHDDYHRFWGEDEEQAILSCREEARRLPRGEAGGPGPSLECALQLCQRSLDEDDEALCPQARGASTCEP